MLPPNWVILQVTEKKKAPYRETGDSESNQLYFEMCDLTGRKVAGAVTIPVPDITEIENYRTVILSTLEPTEVAEILKKIS